MSFSSSRRLPFNSAAMKVTPVMLPFGRASDSANPAETGSLLTA